MEIVIAVVVLLLINQYVYDKYVQRKSSLLVNYPVLARLRYLFEILREPLRQYFGEETFYESRDKVDWVYQAAKDKNLFLSFSVSQPFYGNRFVIKHTNSVLNDDEVNGNFSVTFGGRHAKPFSTKSVVARSAMSDGALSPEATRAFAIAATNARFPINTGEGGLTSNYFFTHKITPDSSRYMEVYEGTKFQKKLFWWLRKMINGAVAVKFYRNCTLPSKAKDTYILDTKSLKFYRIDWTAPLGNFPQSPPKDIADIILQIGSGLYGVRDKKNNFDPDRYLKVMRFCKMTEIKIAQGAKQTGGKIVGAKVTEDIAYYRGVEPGQDLISPNRFPYAKTNDELFDFIGQLQELSEKPVGMKIVVSDARDIEKMIMGMKERFEKGQSIPDFITVDGGDGGSATAPLELMEAVGLSAHNGLFILDKMLTKHDLRKQVLLIASGKVLTPDDVAILLCMGADMVGIARGFMMSGGCIRARHCSGADGKKCPVGMATQDKKKRLSYLVIQKSEHIANYHNQLLKGLKTVMSVMGVAEVSTLSKEHIAFKNKHGEVFFNVDEYYNQKFHL